MSGLRKTIAVLPGDGIGPEVIGAATRVLEDCADSFGHRFDLHELPFGGAAIERCGTPLPAETLEACRTADAILLGAAGGPRWDSLPLEQRPESGLLALRRELGLYINLRPIRLREPLRGISPLRQERARACDFEIVRELAGDIYFGAHELRRENGGEFASDLAGYSTSEIERVARYAFERASQRDRRLTSVDKANVLATSALWRKTVSRLAAEYSRVTVDHQYVDNAAMQLVIRPEQFDVILTSNLFGDILSDEAAALVGSIGLVPSMSRGAAEQGALYEPIHGSAPTLAGKDTANPLGAIFCVSMMLRESFGLAVEAEWIESAVDHVLERGYRTADIAEPKSVVVGGANLLDRVCRDMNESLVPTEHYGWGV